ncbi:hypothetical protein [Deinococcus soli (ex Cha et al. 2016)]|uniref:Uncharacterized protein n=1 Tax=Deinococcus soli (ex Cha et al. 2016) TaxID=1309411 RepID=A0ACC6KPL7_9DEIO|nr:hypothetical protein [Deinococcus soli (ex Cha et al. 2016)]MDR6330596.1 hypothetical protein [Deinococcus soli (ex Cha et al. 2016)]MDR6754373.1 hypothetical protein [Deinococcus soli (ex Cha et al. 2016)]
MERARRSWVRTCGRRVRVQANARSFPRLVRLGFIGTGQRGGYTVMEADGVVLAGRLDSD